MTNFSDARHDHAETVAVISVLERARQQLGAR